MRIPNKKPRSHQGAGLPRCHPCSCPSPFGKGAHTLATARLPRDDGLPVRRLSGAHPPAAFEGLMPLQAGPFVPCAGAGFHLDRLSVASLGEYYSCPPPLFRCCTKSMREAREMSRRIGLCPIRSPDNRAAASHLRLEPCVFKPPPRHVRLMGGEQGLPPRIQDHGLDRYVEKAFIP